MNNPLDVVWARYETARDAIRVARRVVEKSIRTAMTPRHVFVKLTSEQSTARLDEAMQELENFVALGMVAAFEKALRDWLIRRMEERIAPADDLEKSLVAEIQEEIAYWNLSGRIIDKIFRTTIPEELRGMVKQIIDHRNEVAHGQASDSSPPGYAKPKPVYERLTAFLQACGMLAAK